MNLGICGIVDICLVVLLLIMLFIGYKKGFMEKFLNMSKVLCGFICSVLFCNSFATTLKSWGLFYPSIYNNIHGKLTDVVTTESTKEAAATLYQKLGFPEFLANFLAKSIDIDTASLADTVANSLSMFLMVIIAFLLLFFGTTILFFVLKIVVNLLREVKAIKVIDGILGIALYGVLYVAFVYVAFGVLALIIDLGFMEQAKNFLTVDMQLGNDNFRLSKYLYENNIIVNFIKLFI